MVLQVEIDTDALLEPLTEAAREAGEIALRYFRHGERTHANVEHKHGGSPVTEADLLVDHFLEKRLREIVPDAAWMSEEIADSPARLRQAAGADRRSDRRDARLFQGRSAMGRLDRLGACGTLRFAGVVHAPALAETYSAIRGRGAAPPQWGEDQRVAAQLAAGRDAFGTRRLCRQRFSECRRRHRAVPEMASLAMRLVLIASGYIDAGLVGDKCYPTGTLPRPISS